MSKEAEISRIFLSILLRPSIKVFEKSKVVIEKQKNTNKKSNNSKGCLYAQVLFANIKKVIKIKKNFLNLLTKKIKEIQQIINRSKKKKLRFNMTTKKPSRRQILVSMSLSNSAKIMAISSKHITNINRVLKIIKSDVMADFICTNNCGFIITTNQVVFSLYFNMIKKYIQNVDIIDSKESIVSQLPQSKFYLRILGILYFIKNTNILINKDLVEQVFKSTYIFNDIILVFRSQVIKVSPKSNIEVIWIDIQDA